MDCIYYLKGANGARYEALGNDSMQLRLGDFCVVRKDNCQDYAQVLRWRELPENYARLSELPHIQRQATMHDKGVATENIARGKSAFRTAAQMVETMNLPMKLLNAFYSFDQKLVTIQFTADGRVDFRELVKELSRVLGARLDLRQIGVRDETGICGGIAVCGQVLCCSRFLKEFNSINVRMAKDQDLSLTPGTISGVCGRLKCCLKFEHEGYVEMEREMPRRGELCECAKGRGRVCDRNILTKMVTLNLEAGGQITLPSAEIQYKNRSRQNTPAPATAAAEDDGEWTADAAAAAPPEELRATPGVAEPGSATAPDGGGEPGENTENRRPGNPEAGDPGKRRDNFRRRNRNNRKKKNNPSGDGKA